MRLKDKIAVITGAAQGIGFACAKRFAQEGAKVMMSDINAKKGKEAAAELTKAGFDVRFKAGDAGIKKDADALIAAAIKAYGQIDIMLNNAGIVRAADFLDVTEEDYDLVLRVNLKSAFLCGQAAARHMVKKGVKGVIINMSSVNAVLAIPTILPYVVSKGGVNQLTKAMSLSLAPHGIRVNAIGPGTILTDLAKAGVLSDDAARRRILSRTPLGRCGEPEEVASVALFLASEDSSYLSGQTIYPDGGRMALNYVVPVAD